MRSSHLYTSFGTFNVQIGQLFEAQKDFEFSEEFEIDDIFQFPTKTAILPFSTIFQRVTLLRMIDQFGRKRYQKKRNYVIYQLL